MCGDLAVPVSVGIRCDYKHMESSTKLFMHIHNTSLALLNHGQGYPALLLRYPALVFVCARVFMRDVRTLSTVAHENRL